MSEDPKQQEPSMEEILASIRRIISEDGEGNDDQETAEAREDDDVLDLTDVVDAEEPVDGMSDSFTDDPVDLGIDLVDEEIDVEETTAPEPAMTGLRTEPVDDEPARQQAAGASGGAREKPEAEDADRIVSPMAAALSAAALGELSRANLDSSTRIEGGHTLESLVREMLRPMLKQWLDVHLPHIVETAVRDEVARIAREAKGD